MAERIFTDCMGMQVYLKHRSGENEKEGKTGEYQIWYCRFFC